MKFPRLILISIAALATVAALGGCGNETSPTGVAPSLDTTPPPVPTGLSVWTDAVTGRDFVQWDASAAPDIAGYQVYEYSPSPTRDNAYVLAGDLAASQTSYTMPIVGEDTQMFVRVRAVDGSGNRSALSNSFSVTVHAVDGSTGGGTGDHGVDHP